MKRSKLAAFAALVIAAVVLVVAMVSGQQATTPGSALSTTPAPPAAVSAPANPSALPAVNASQLPKEARQTLALIAKGGPYPYREDDENFGNFEGLLPKKPSGFYREYTVATPEASNRGARRIIAGKDGVKYYTPDHYESFKFIVEDK
ncbi:ribonuclease domain-containing protein [Paenarthrobacter sp. NPDC018779]|uniref:ribonuclease domain-containing protein n=1 Tax=Paenarthrobacter sp. NPDC018779 TaxID=3364375 RepID=UPI0037C987B6